MHRTPLAVVLFTTVLTACGGGSEPATRPRTATSSTTTPATTTTAPAPDLNAVRVVLTKVSDLTGGTAMAIRDGDPALYIALQSGQLVAFEDGKTRTVLDLADRISAGGERGLLGVTFSPDGAKLYVHYSDPNGDTTLEEFAFADDGPDIATRRVLLSVAQPQPNHNGGQLEFGPDGMLYLALGDGGGGNDVGSGHAEGGNGQSLNTLLGKILRIDPAPSGDAPYTIPQDNPFAPGGGRPEIWVYGLRNPWRFSFDRQTNDMWIADVGQGSWEEIDMVAFDQSTGVNFGWNLLEGTHDLRGGAPPGSTAPPVFETSHADGNCSITGGFVYRGTKIPDLVGAYVFSDYCNPAIRAIRVEAGTVTVVRDLGVSAASVSSFGQDNDGELYVISQTEGVFRIDPA